MCGATLYERVGGPEGYLTHEERLVIFLISSARIGYAKSKKKKKKKQVIAIVSANKRPNDVDNMLTITKDWWLEKTLSVDNTLCREVNIFPCSSYQQRNGR